ncbi:phosphatase PAP2 family protein [Pilimelia columellifera]|uniref:phosphatase PAP2 family protein n=1 Tax=Pilimelia columellifera TaxID=706574 RepID=UPI003CD0BCBA
MTTFPAPRAAPSEPVADARLRRRRRLAMTCWTAAFVAGWLGIGLPIDPVYAFVWLWSAAIAWNSHRPWREHLRFGRDWLLIVLLLVAYNLSRGFADNGATPHVLELIVTDRVMFGWLTDGQVPTVWLQRRLYDPDAIRWWDVLVSWVYFSHFVAALAAAVVLWLRDRDRWAAYLRRFAFLCLAGLATYFAYPAAPPWWAAKYGLLEDVARISTRGWSAVGMHGAGNLLNAGQLGVNPVAAMPSLHTAFALFVVVFFLSTTRRRWWPLLLAYPLAMTFTLVYAGEHYVIDVLVGWAYVGLTFVIVGAAERWWRSWSAQRPQHPVGEQTGEPTGLVGVAVGGGHRPGAGVEVDARQTE